MEDTKTFAEFAISEDLLRAIEDMGFEEPTPIQAMAIPLILEGHDVTGQAQTGTGKTAAFGVPIIEGVDPNNKSVQALVLSPTRELAIQTAEEFARLMKYKQGLNVVPIYGGQPIERQLKVLRGPAQVIIGTPGRVIDHLKRGTLNLEDVRIFVLDEADQMLDMGFRDDIEEIFHHIPENHQTILFSATMPAQILEITHKFQNKPQFVKITRRELTVPQIEQTYIEVRERDKLEALCRLLDMNNPDLALIFCNTKRTVEDLMSHLHARGYFVEALHGDMKQIHRDRVMAHFRSGSIDVLIATDVAARGIDVDGVDMVFNYDVPQDVEYYVHRIGRTGRAGRTGKSVTFVSPREIYKLRDIQRYAKIKIAKTPFPSLDDVAERKMQMFLDKVREILNAGDLEKYLPMIEQLLETENNSEITSIEVAAALLKMHLDTDKSNTTENGDLPTGESKQNSNSFENTGAEPGMVRFRITLGKNQQIRPKDIVGAFAGECDIPGNCIGRIDLYSNYSFVEIPLEYAATVLEIMNQKTIRGQELEIQTATPRNERREMENNHERAFRSYDSRERRSYYSNHGGYINNRSSGRFHSDERRSGERRNFERRNPRIGNHGLYDDD
ncbi:MAG TPA: DEAD/DEAH box helicase [Methanocorpusculum sp.]|nr:DEAD/DEAH box helicase [Methanocorpusculum sp.]HJK02169.1 DEAD/DEAH box helicase [Methanocorpusculum sp.]